MQLTAQQRKIALTLLALLVLGAVFWFQNTDASPSQDRARDTSSQSGNRASSGDSGTDPDSGLPFIEPADLPGEARETLELIDDGGPFPYDRDGITFENREEILPDEPRGYYAEYTVETPGSSDRGARRIVTGDGGEFYWTQDHYDSFERIAR